MKKIVILCIGALAWLWTCPPAAAVDFKFKGRWEYSMQHVNRHFLRDNALMRQEAFNVYQRLLLQMDAQASPDLSGTVIFHIDSLWGSEGNPWTPDGASGGALGADGTKIQVAQAYLDWRVPETDLHLRMGRQLFINPCLVAGSAILVDRATGISWNWGLAEHFSLGGYWVRSRNDNYVQGNPWSGSQFTRASDSSNSVDDADFFNVQFNFHGDGFQIVPWFMYGRVGRNSGEMTREMMMPQVWRDTPYDGDDYGHAYFAGLNGEWTGWEPFRFALDFNYGAIRGISEPLSREGWFVAASAEYALDRMTPKLVAWYGSGDDGNIANGSERMPSLSASWWTSSFGHSGYWMYGASHGYNSDSIHLSPVGTAGLVFMLDNIRIFDKMRHVLRLGLEWGTNDPSMAKYIRAVDRAGANFTNLSLRQDYAVNFPYDSLLYLTTNDNLMEINFDTEYKVYENLKLVVEAGVIWLNLDDGTWCTQGGYDKVNHRVGINFIYSF